MKGIYRGAAIAALGLSIAGSARAATLYTPPAEASYADEYLGCRVTNVSNTSRMVKIEVRNYAGSVLSSATKVISPFVTERAQDLASGVYCKFTVLDGTSRHVRASAVYIDSLGTVTTTIPAK